MLAKRLLQFKYKRWNQKYGAPYGHSNLNRKVMLIEQRLKHYKAEGFFSTQENNSTREFEYPWAFYAAEIKPGLKCVEIGGGLSGFQFVLDKNGCKVINCDPEEGAEEWACNPQYMNILNKMFKTNVILYNTTLDKAKIKSNSIDRLFSISVIEHLSYKEIEKIMETAYNILNPNGLFIITIDLFLTCVPFTIKKECKFGRNVNIMKILKNSPFRLKTGIKKELFGYPDFNKEEIMINLEDYYIGAFYPCLTQCLVLEK